MPITICTSRAISKGGTLSGYVGMLCQTCKNPVLYYFKLKTEASSDAYIGYVKEEGKKQVDERATYLSNLVFEKLNYYFSTNLHEKKTTKDYKEGYGCLVRLSSNIIDGCINCGTVIDIITDDTEYYLFSSLYDAEKWVTTELIKKRDKIVNAINSNDYDKQKIENSISKIKELKKHLKHLNEQKAELKELGVFNRNKKNELKAVIEKDEESIVNEGALIGIKLKLDDNTNRLLDAYCYELKCKIDPSINGQLKLKEDDRYCYILDSVGNYDKYCEKLPLAIKEKIQVMRDVVVTEPNKLKPKEDSVQDREALVTRSIYCHKCGNKLAPGSVFCNKCGERIIQKEGRK